jgi:hypothetical protein
MKAGSGFARATTTGSLTTWVFLRASATDLSSAVAVSSLRSRVVSTTARSSYMPSWSTVWAAWCGSLI